MHADGKEEDFSVLARLDQLGAELCIVSRNDRYHLENQLEILSIRKHFRFVMADFRPKSYQVKHLLWLYHKLGCQFSKILFVDDYHLNIQRVRKDFPEIFCYQFGLDIQSLEELTELV